VDTGVPDIMEVVVVAETEVTDLDLEE